MARAWNQLSRNRCASGQLRTLHDGFQEEAERRHRLSAVFRRGSLSWTAISNPRRMATCGIVFRQPNVSRQRSAGVEAGGHVFDKNIPLGVGHAQVALRCGFARRGARPFRKRACARESERQGGAPVPATGAGYIEDCEIPPGSDVSSTVRPAAASAMPIGLSSSVAAPRTGGFGAGLEPGSAKGSSEKRPIMGRAVSRTGALRCSPL